MALIVCVRLLFAFQSILPLLGLTHLSQRRFVYRLHAQRLHFGKFAPGGVAVMTNVFPANAPGAASRPRASAFGHTVAFFNFANSRLLPGRANQSAMAAAEFGPTPSICCKVSASAFCR